MSEKYDVLITGGGLSGLLSASLLSRKGLKVCILEKNKEAGGMIQPFKRNGFFLDTGMNFFGAYKDGQIQHELFSIFGISKELLISEISNFELILDKEKYLIPNNYDAFKKRLTSYFPEEKEGINSFVEKIKEIFGSLTLEKILNPQETLKYLSLSASEFIDSVTKNEKLRSVLKFNGLLYGNNFETLPLYIYAVITGSFLQSAGMFTKGTNHFIEILKNKIFENGGLILTEKEVVKFKSEGRRITHCICKDGTEFFADNFISALHPQVLFPKIESGLLKSFYRKRISELPNSESVLTINIILKDDALKFDEKPKFIRSEKKSILLYHPLSGKNGDYSRTLKIMTGDDISEYKEWFDTKSSRRGKLYEEFKERKANEIFSLIEKQIPGFKNSVKQYYISTPLTFRDYTASPGGSAYGILKDFTKISESIIPVRTKFENLYLNGQSVNFHGLLGVSVTSLSVCSAILDGEITK